MEFPSLCFRSGFESSCRRACERLKKWEIFFFCFRVKFESSCRGRVEIPFDEYFVSNDVDCHSTPPPDESYVKRFGIVIFLPERVDFVDVESCVAASFELVDVCCVCVGRSAVVVRPSLAVNAGFNRSMLMLVLRPRMMTVKNFSFRLVTGYGPSYGWLSDGRIESLRTKTCVVVCSALDSNVFGVA